jgi:hypothetical protein
MGFTLRSFPPSKGVRASPPELTHLPFFPPVPPTRLHRPVPADRGSWALTLSRVPREPVMCLTNRFAGCSLGFYPSRAFGWSLESGFDPISSHALCRTAPHGTIQPAPQSLDELLPCLPRRDGQSCPLRVYAPFQSWTLISFCPSEFSGLLLEKLALPQALVLLWD